MTVNAPGKPFFTSSSSTLGDNNPHTEAVRINRVEALPPELSSKIVSYLGWNEQYRMSQNRLFQDSVLRYWQEEYRDPLRAISLLGVEPGTGEEGNPLPFDLGSLTASYWDCTEQGKMIQLGLLTNIVAQAQHDTTLGFIKAFRDAFSERESNGRDYSIEAEPRLQAEIELESHLLSAIEHGHIASVEEFFDHFPHGLADPNAIMRQALHRAAEYGHTEIVALIIQKTGNALKDSLVNAFYTAVLRRRANTVKFLIGQLSEKLTDERFASAMQWLAQRGDNMDVWEVVLSLEGKIDGDTVHNVLMSAVISGNISCIATLLKFPSNKLTAHTLLQSLKRSISYEKAPITKLLLEKIKEADDLDIMRTDVQEALSEAMTRKKISIVEVFLTTIPNVISAPFIRLMLITAVASDLYEIAELLLQHVRDRFDDETLIEAREIALGLNREVFADLLLDNIRSWTIPEPEKKQ